MEEEIIIDGIKVEDCEFFDKNDCQPQLSDCLAHCTPYPECTCYDCCSEYPNCYYKQLKRLQQDYVNLSKTFEHLKTSYQENQEYFLELRKENAELKAYKVVNEDFKTAWEELKAENERLKEELDFLKNNTYREALREIREYINDNTDFDKGDYFLSETPAYDILQIIALYGE